MSSFFMAALLANWMSHRSPSRKTYHKHVTPPSRLSIPVTHPHHNFSSREAIFGGFMLVVAPSAQANEELSLQHHLRCSLRQVDQPEWEYSPHCQRTDDCNTKCCPRHPTGIGLPGID